MKTLPSSALVLADYSGAPFGFIRLSPHEPREKDQAGTVRGDCIFDIAPTSPLQASRPEVAWLNKRRFKRAGEHRFKVDTNGEITISQADFVLKLVPEEGSADLRIPRLSPPLLVRWQT